MILGTIHNIRQERGNCYLSDLCSLPTRYLGESPNSQKASSLLLFEDSRSLGPGSASHWEIRQYGKGRFSHWGRQLYFSTSDNTDPVVNGRTYAVVLPENDDEHITNTISIAQSMGENAQFLKEVLCTCLSTQGSEMHSVYTFRMLKMFVDQISETIENKNILEVGSSPTNGLAICLGLAGASSVVLNNKEQIPNKINRQFAENVALLFSLVQPLKRELSEVLVLDRDEDYRLNPEIFTTIDRKDARLLPNTIPERIGTFDLIFSVSVLEHIRHLDEVLIALYELGRSGCVSIHGVDARDHTDFNSPLKYLYVPEELFNQTYDESNNRWRITDYLKKIKNSGWEKKCETRIRYIKALDTLSSGRTDVYRLVANGPEKMFTDDIASVKSVISQNEVKTLDAAFHSFTAQELSALVFWLLNIKE